MTRFDPPPARPLPAGRRDMMRRQLETLVREHPGRRGWRKPTVLAGAAAVVIGTSAGAIAYVQQSQPVTNKGEARCYTVASLAGGDNFHGTTIAAAAAPPGSTAQVNQAVSVCAALWRQGFLLAGAAGIARSPDTTERHRVPRLIACVMPNGTAAVFPGGSRTCAKLGLPRATKQ